MIDALLTWQTAVLVGCFTLWWLHLRESPSRHAFAAVACYTASVILFNVWIVTDDLDMAYKVFNVGVNGALVVYLAVLFWFLLDRPAADDLPAKTLWVVVLVAETWSLAFNNIGCNLVLETATRAEIAEVWGTTASKYVCGREIGEWFEFAPLAIEIAIMYWLIARYGQAKDSLRNKAPDSGNSS